MLTLWFCHCVDVDDLRIGADGTVIVFFSDGSRFEYHTQSRLWREISPEILLDDKSKGQNEEFNVATSTGQKIGAAGLQLAQDEAEIS